MITRIIAGLKWHAISPSFYELVVCPRVDLAFVGDQWFLQYPGEDDQPRMFGFQSRDEAAAQVARALHV